MKSIDTIPVSKLARTGKLMSTGLKVGRNYVKQGGKAIVNGKWDQDELDKDNARDVYDSLKQLKGSALKVAQMMSMDKSILPAAYVEQFSAAQFNVPPLSAPLVRKVITKSLGKTPEELFDTFSSTAVHAASIGQVHVATVDGKKLAVKIQYPGVAESIGSDLAMVKPIAKKMFNIKGKGSDKYFEEVENKLLEETDYRLELENSVQISKKCSHIEGLQFPTYDMLRSSDRVLTMEYMEGLHISEWVAANEHLPSEVSHKLGQALWDFYMYQIHELRRVHADPHPGNFKVGPDNQLVAMDFGCIKEVPSDFYKAYFKLADQNVINDNAALTQSLLDLQLLLPDDTPGERAYFYDAFREMLSLFVRPMLADNFDFGDAGFWDEVASLSQKMSKDPQLRSMDGARGSEHFLYMNRSFFGLFNLLHDLKASIEVNAWKRFVNA